FKFDKNNYMHFALTANTDTNLSGANRLLYAKSEDGGITWKRANGTTLIGFPLRGIDNHPNSLDVVAESSADPFFGALASVIVDTNGKPAVGVDGTWHVWNGSVWSTNSPQNHTNIPSAQMGYRLPDNSLLLSRTSPSKLFLTPNLDSPAIGYDFPGYNEVSVLDDYSLSRSGIVYGIGLKADKSEEVVKTTITPAPLPTGWTGQDIDTNTEGYSGNSGYLNGAFVLSSYGVELGDASDSFYFASEPMSGDGSLTARVTFSGVNAKAGIMLREGFTPGSKQASMLLAPGDTNSSAQFVYRITDNANCGVIPTNGVKSPFWFRIVRSGDVFTGFSSPDGLIWTKSGSTTIPMNKNIYAGFAATGYANHWFMQTATFDKVTAPSGMCTRANPTMTLTPSIQTGPAGASVSYALDVTNNDSDGCTPASYNLNATIPSGISSVFNVSSLTIPAQSKGSALMTLTSQAASPATTYTFNVKASNATDATYSASTNGSYTISNSCVVSAPTVAITPGTQTSSGTTAVNYNVSLTNNDSSSCPQRLFSFDASASDYYIKTFMEPYNIFALPGKTVNSLLTITPQAGLNAGTYQLSTSTQNGGLGTAQFIYQPKTACTLAQPSISISPNSQTTSGTSAVTYKVSLVNNDSATCPQRIFGFSASASDYYLKTFMEPYNIQMQPGTSAVSVLTITPQVGLKAGTFQLKTFTQNGGLATANLIYQQKPVCVKSAPTVTISPSSQKSSGLKPVNYTVTLVNNNSVACDQNVFSFSYTTPWPLNSVMEPRNIIVKSGQSVTSKLTLTPTAANTSGTYTATVTNKEQGETAFGTGTAQLMYKKL
ncbi:MAG: hypothetical protein PSV35_01295, partial [bacterium]|nr:hypothetical protein [bacterium]